MPDPDVIPPEYLEAGYRAAARHGFAVPRGADPLLTPLERQRIVRNRGLRAATSLVELQHWLADEDKDVRDDARAAISRCLRVAYTGERREPIGFMDRVVIRRIDRLAERVLARGRDADQPEPKWSLPEGIRRIRTIGIIVAVLFATAGMALLGTGFPIAALILIVASAGVDMAEGAFARAARAHDAQMRWLSCIVSHLGDALILAGVFSFEYRFGRGDTGYIILGAGILSLFASLVRVSALQAGFRFWRSPLERVVRFSAFGLYCITAAAGATTVGVAGAAILLGAFALGEIIRVIWRIQAHQVGRGGFIFLTDDSATCWSFEEAEVEDRSTYVLDMLEDVMSSAPTRAETTVPSGS